MKNNRYPDGYLPKVAYHMVKGNHDRATDFLKSHIDKYGTFNAKNLNRLNELMEGYRNAQING